MSSLQILRFLSLCFVVTIHVVLSATETVTLTSGSPRNQIIPVFPINPIKGEHSKLPSVYLHNKADGSLVAILPENIQDAPNRQPIAQAVKRNYFYSTGRVQNESREFVHYLDFPAFFVLDTSTLEGETFRIPVMKREIDDELEALRKYAARKIKSKWIQISFAVDETGRVANASSDSIKQSKLRIIFGKNFEYLGFSPLVADGEAVSCQLNFHILNQTVSTSSYARDPVSANFRPVQVLPLEEPLQLPTTRNAWIQFSKTGHVRQVTLSGIAKDELDTKILRTLRKWKMDPADIVTDTDVYWTQISLAFEPESQNVRLAPEPDEIPHTMPQLIEAPGLEISPQSEFRGKPLVVKYVVKENGKPDQITVEGTENKVLINDLTRYISASTYIPGTKDNKKISAPMSQPFSFF
ncbi:MAG: hypothetical protein AAF546_11730 [Verrucomicrobiota bacterium]